ncbi:MAG: O-acetyl-ADP-ribose deacetylase [Planctomycetota bacterium]|nr:MAG: O-acetyl-ADP-ribose deacetylase [Planctomycetota bacterium]
MTDLKLVLGDITKQEVDAIVNAANAQLLPGGGVCGAIHAAGGAEIAKACQSLAPIQTGQAVATTAGHLPARWVIHAVGPIWEGGQAGEAEALASAYQAALAVADSLGARTVAFPAISCGIYGYPVQQAAQIAWHSLSQGAQTCHRVEEIRIVLFDPPMLETFRLASSIES